MAPGVWDDRRRPGRHCACPSRTGQLRARYGGRTHASWAIQPAVSWLLVGRSRETHPGLGPARTERRRRFQAARLKSSSTHCTDECPSAVRIHAQRLGAPLASACPSAATASATISSNPEGSVASAAPNSVQPPSSASASARRSRASITATSTSSRCTPTCLRINGGLVAPTVADARRRVSVSTVAFVADLCVCNIACVHARVSPPVREARARARLVSKCV